MTGADDEVRSASDARHGGETRSARRRALRHDRRRTRWRRALVRLAVLAVVVGATVAACTAIPSAPRPVEGPPVTTTGQSRPGPVTST